ncbi:DUF927 domain-containing protein [Thiomicrorhabdus indica]|uniref:DUF927 domain-containing protein n=1 Tax=Thiomicrorhabdus indica TaxID=2267253 RepID=UPI00102DEF60|nr:DUF927 domain-containing protein [Thiomicrorhabdus indica]
MSNDKRQSAKVQAIANQKTQIMPEGFTFGESGLTYTDPNNENASPIWICSKLDVSAMTRDHHGENWGRVLEFRDKENRAKRWVMPMKLLAGRGDVLHSTLLSMGLSISNSQRAKSLLAQYIQACEGDGISICVNRLGWFESCYVLPTSTIGETNGQTVLYQTDRPSNLGFSTAGKLEQWRANVARFATGNSRIAFAISTAFTAPLLSKLGIEGGGFHYRGESSKGKTISLYAAGSVWGSHERKKTWRATSNGLEMAAYEHNDGLLLLDEMGEMNPKEIGNTVYMLANGQAKQRHNDNEPPKTWRVLFLSTGEIDIKSALNEAGNTSRAGHEVRLVDLEAIVGEYGVFETLLEGFQESRLQAETLQANTGKYYGTAGIEFLNRLTDDLPKALDFFRMFKDAFIQDHTPEGANSQVRRVLNRFAMVAAGGELATSYGITGWEKGEAFKAAKACFESWLGNLKSAKHSHEEMQALEQVRGFVERYGESRFAELSRADDDHAPRTIDRVGYRYGESVNGELEYVYYILPEMFKTEVCKGINFKLAIHALKKHGHLKHQPGRNTTVTPRETETGKRASCYAIRSTVLDEE